MISNKILILFYLYYFTEVKEETQNFKKLVMQLENGDHSFSPVSSEKFPKSNLPHENLIFPHLHFRQKCHLLFSAIYRPTQILKATVIFITT